MERAVWHYIETYGLLEGRLEVGAAVSGGPDSMALLICLRNLSRVHGFRVTALHLDHRTRNGASSEDARFVADFCEAEGIPLVAETADVPLAARHRNIGLELAGRLAREAFFERVVASGALDVVATAHHMDDNAESVLMHLIRGCGTCGLEGISPARGVLIRPFLGLARGDIDQYIEDNGIPFRVDASNNDTSFDRNFIRHELMPLIRGRLNPSFSVAAGRLSRAAAQDEEYLMGCGRQLLNDICISQRPDSITISTGGLARAHPAVAGRAVREALRMIGRGRDVEHGHIEAVLRVCRAARTGTRVMLGGGLQAEIVYAALVIGPVRAPRACWQTPLRIPGRTQLANGAALACQYVEKRGNDTRGERCVYIDAERLPEDAVIRLRQPGDVFRPLGGPGTKKLKDFFIDRKVPRAKRDSTPLLADGENVLWVIGEALSEDLAVRDGASRICRLSYEGGESRAEEEKAVVAGSGEHTRTACGES